MKILFATSEVVPFSKTGGLADVSGALPKALSKLGHEVVVVVPFYRVTREKGDDIQRTGLTFSVPISDREESGEILIIRPDGGPTVYFVEKPDYYDRDEIYAEQGIDYPDNAERFIFFSKAVLELCRTLEYAPDIIHCNDWQTGLTPLSLKIARAQEPLFNQTASVFTIHNISYQGLLRHLDMHLTNLPWELFSPDGLEYFGKINLLKAGIVGSDIITTVSLRYAREIQTPEFGCGMEGILNKYSDQLFGILNGVDYDEWNPEIDSHIVAHYGPADLSGKAACRADVLEEIGLARIQDTPLIGMVSRLVDNKGFDILLPVMEDIMHEGFQLVLLGAGENRITSELIKIADRHPDRMGVKFGFSNSLAHKIEAGADMFLMPSRYEPCGLNQMYSLKYGTVPIVHATGGLDETIIDYPTSPEDSGNGFKFTDYTSDSLLAKLYEAREFYANGDEWKRIMLNGMACDFSWNASASKYEKLYQRAMSEKHR